MLAHITGEESAPTLKGHLARPRRHFQSHDRDRRRHQSREEGSGWVGWLAAISASSPTTPKRARTKTFSPFKSRRGMDGRRARQKVEESNQLCSSSFYSFLLRSSVRAGEALYRRYSSSVFLACITERFSQHFTFFARPRPHTICSVCCAGNEDDTDSISGNVDSSEAHSDPFSSRITGGAATESPQSASTTLHDENCCPMSAPPPKPSLT